MMFWEGSGIGSEVILGINHRVILSTLLSTRWLLSSCPVLSCPVSNIQAIHNIGSWVYDHTSVVPAYLCRKMVRLGPTPCWWAEGTRWC